MAARPGDRRHRPFRFPQPGQQFLGFPVIFRGALDVRATTINEEMRLAATHALADMAVERGLEPDNILPTMDDWEVFPREAGRRRRQGRRAGPGRQAGDVC